MARHNELMAMQAVGITSARLTRSALLSGLSLVLLLGLSSEYLSTPLALRAEVQRMLAQSNSGDLLGGQGLWSNDGRRFLNLRGLRDGFIPEGIDIYQFDRNGQLRLSVHVAHAEVEVDREWTLVDVWRKRLLNGRLVTRHLERLEMGELWAKEELPILSFPTGAISIAALYRHAARLQAAGQQSGRYQLAFWQRIVWPLVAGVMVMLAVPVCASPDPGRNQAFSRRITLGGIAGILFYLGVRVIHTSGLLLGLPPLLLLVAPPLFRRMR